MRHLIDAEGLTEQVHVESAGTGAWHLGERADRRARETASARGITLDRYAQQFTGPDFDRFDYVIAMDDDIRAALVRMTRERDDVAKIHAFRKFDPDSPSGAGVPDPYYGGPDGFSDVFDICTAGCQGLLDHLRQTHLLHHAGRADDSR